MGTGLIVVELALTRREDHFLGAGLAWTLLASGCYPNSALGEG
jgi:hypothetical protein